MPPVIGWLQYWSRSSDSFVKRLLHAIGTEQQVCQLSSKSQAHPRAGKESLQTFAVEDEWKTPLLQAVDDKYVEGGFQSGSYCRYHALCASAALLKWLVTQGDLACAAGTLSIRWKASEGRERSLIEMKVNVRDHVHWIRDHKKFGIGLQHCQQQDEQYAVE